MKLIKERTDRIEVSLNTLWQEHNELKETSDRCAYCNKEKV